MGVITLPAAKRSGTATDETTKRTKSKKATPRAQIRIRMVSSNQLSADLLLLRDCIDGCLKGLMVARERKTSEQRSVETTRARLAHLNNLLNANSGDP